MRVQFFELTSFFKKWIIWSGFAIKKTLIFKLSFNGNFLNVIVREHPERELVVFFCVYCETGSIYSLKQEPTLQEKLDNEKHMSNFSVSPNIFTIAQIDLVSQHLFFLIFQFETLLSEGSFQNLSHFNASNFIHKH